MLDSLDTLIAFVLIITVVSLLITIVVQMITSAFNLRGKNVAWGLAETFEAIEPGLTARAKGQVKGLGKELADHVLKDSLLSDVQFGRWVRPASAIRADELFDVLHRIAIGKKVDTPSGIRDNVITLFTALGVDKTFFEKIAKGGQEVKATQDLVKGLFDAVGKLPEGDQKKAITTAFNDVSTRFSALTTAATGRSIELATDAEEAIQHVYQKFEHWFETGQERAQEWFSTHARVVTAVFAVIFAFWLQLDTIEIFKMVSSDRALRDKLVAQVSGVVGQAGKVLGDYKSVLEKPFSTWRNGLKDDDKKKITDANAVPVADDTREKLRERVAEALKASPNKDDELKAFDTTMDTTREELKKEVANYNLVKVDLDKTGFELFPRKGWRWDKKAVTEFKGGSLDDNNPKFLSFLRVMREHGYGDHFWGMFFSALLLSLGAPFWFNILKSLASMRSTLVDNISDERKQAQKQPGGSKPGTPPPTV